MSGTRTRRTVIALLAAVFVAAMVSRVLAAPADERGIPMPAADAAVSAPEFPAGLEWLNTDRPLRLADLRGKVVLLDFWTYCCINCMHVIPDLKRLEEKYPNELVVIGVHSAKFLAEQETANIRSAILRYGLRHPVVNDNHMAVWKAYAVRAWPTLVLIDPDGKVAGRVSGEGIYGPMDEAIGTLVKTFDANGRLDRRPLNLKLERSRMPESLLEFPGKVLADEAGGRLFIADSGHNRIVVVSLADRMVTGVIGSGRQGLKDGPPAAAEFNHPQGMALDGDVLYVADTENHAIRRVDLKAGAVTTLAGTGEQARRFNVPGPGRTTPLNSPWDLLVHEGTLYIAMAGSHQLWQMNLKTGDVSPFAGSGREARTDGPLAGAALAQPSGIATDGKRLYFADSEVSSIRAADLDPRGGVETIVGGDLFDFGDRDGTGLDVRLQHPLGVAYRDGILYVADTYNNKIKRIRPADRSCQSWLGTGKRGLADGKEPTFNEPGGISLAGGRAYIADTNNHAIRLADLATGQVETLAVRNMERLRPPPEPGFAGETIRLAPQRLAPGQAALAVTLALPPGYQLNPQAPSTVAVATSDAAVLAPAGKTVVRPTFPIRVPVKAAEGKAELTLDLVLYYCQADAESVCLFKEIRLVVPVEVAKGAGNTLAAGYTLSVP